MRGDQSGNVSRTCPECQSLKPPCAPLRETRKTKRRRSRRENRRAELLIIFEPSKPPLGSVGRFRLYLGVKGYIIPAWIISKPY